MIHEYEYEPVKGLPCRLPEDETILWQGAPRWLTLAKHLCHIRFVTLYFALLIGWAVTAAAMDGRSTGDTLNAVAWLSALMGVAVGLLGAFAFLCARSTIYTVTTRRVVLRYGLAFTKAVNVPLRIVEGVGLRLYADGSGDIPLTLAGPDKIAYLVLWPHVRPWHFKHTQPMLRGVANAAKAVEALRGALSVKHEVATADNPKLVEAAKAKGAAPVPGQTPLAA